MNQKWKITKEEGLYLLAVILAAGIRFVSLGKIPLSESEASLAYQALEISRGSDILQVASQPAYLVFTSALFFIFQASNFFARFWPALLGTILTLVPYSFRKILGQKPAIILAFLIALDPGLVAHSRQADGSTWALAFTFISIGALLKHKTALAGACFGLALLGGPEFWTGLVSIVLAYGLYRFIFSSQDNPINFNRETVLPQWKMFLIWTGGAFLVGGSAFLILPLGLTAAAESVVEFFRGWGRASEVPISHLLLALVVYQPLTFLFALVKVVRQGFKPEPLDRFLIVWWLSALVVAFIYPSREVMGLAWTLIPMLALAGRQLAEILSYKGAYRHLGLILAGVTVVLITFVWLNSISFFNPLRGNVDTQLRIIGIAAAFLLVLASALLIGWGWSLKTAGKGLVWGLTAVLVIYGISAAWSAGGLGNYAENQLWRTAPAIVQEDLLVETMEDISEWNSGTQTGLDVVVVNRDIASLRWALRNLTSVTYANSLPPQSTPSMIVTIDQPTVGLPAPYRGQDFIWEKRPSWSLMLTQEWLRWAVFKSAPAEDHTLILWVREDRFPGSNSAGQD